METAQLAPHKEHSAKELIVFCASWGIRLERESGWGDGFTRYKFYGADDTESARYRMYAHGLKEARQTAYAMQEGIVLALGGWMAPAVGEYMKKFHNN